MKIADHRRQPTAAVRSPRLTRIAAVVAAALFATPWSPVQAGATLYSFGAAAGDTALTRCDDCFIQTSWAGLGPAGSSLSLPFFRSSYTSSFVNNNGGLSFNSGVGTWDLGAFPTGSLPPIVAPFWADVDTRNALSGQVWYRTSQDASLLTTLAQDVKSAYGGVNLSFNPTFAQIVTWDRVGYYFSAADKLNTFQLTLVSDGSHSYTLFKYPTGGIGDPIKNWDRGSASPAGSFAAVGFDAGDGVNFFNTPGSRTSSVRNLPNLTGTVPANPGTFVYRLDQSLVPASPGTIDLTYGLASHTWAPAAGSTSWGVNGTNWTALNVNGTPVTRDSPTQWRNGDSAVFGASAGTVTLGGTLVAQRVTVDTSGTTFTASGAGTSLQLDSLEVPSAATVVNFAGSLVVITHAGDAGLKRASAGAPLLQQGALARGKLVFTDTSVLAARDAGMVNGAEIVLNKSAQLQLYTAGATTRASVLSFDNTGGGTGGVLDLRGLSTTLGAVRSQGPSAGAGRITNGGSAAATLTVDFDASSQAFSGVAQNGTGALALNKAGSGSWTLSGANTYTGGTTLAGGTLVLGSAGAIGSTGSISFTGGTLQHSAANPGDYSARFSTAANQLYSIDTGGQSVALATALGSSGGTLDKRGAGALQLSAASTYTGATTVTGGTLALLGSTQSPSFSVASGAALDLRTSVSTGTLDQGGSLLLGANNLTITQDYRNANFGVGNAFNRRAGVTGTAQIRAAGTTQQVLAGTAVSGGTTATPTLTLGNLRVGSTVTRTVQIQNVGSGGPSLRGALQTTGITSAALSGSGVTAQNWSAVSQGATGPVFDVVYSPTQAGALQGQVLAVVNNFDNVAGQTLAITGTAYRPAAASTLPALVQLAAQRVGGALMWPMGLSNTAVDDSFSERLNASIAGTGAITVAGSVSLLRASIGNPALFVGVDTSTAGAKSGTATVTLASDGAGTSGLAALALGTQQVAVSGNVYRAASASALAASVQLAGQRVDGSLTQALALGNTAVADSFSERLNASIAGTGAISVAGSVSSLGPGASSSTLRVGVNTATAGAKSGTATVTLASDGTGTSGLAALALGTQQVAVSGKVYAPAVAQAQTTLVNFGIVRVGDTVATRPVVVGNAATGALTDTLRATLGGAPAPFTAAGTASAVAAGQVDGSSLSVALNTGSAGVFSGAAQIGFASQNPDMADLALAGAAVALQAQVNHLAAAELSLVSGAGSFSGSAGRYTLSFGTLVQGSAALAARLALGNAAPQVGWSDALGGSFDLSALPPGKMLGAAGFGSFSGLAAGTAFDTLVLRLDSAALGDFTGLILLNARSTNAYDPAGRALGPIELHLQGSVVAVPEPQTWLLMLGGLGLLLPKLLRRRSVVRMDSSRT